MAVQAVDVASGEKTEVPHETNGASTPVTIQEKALNASKTTINVAGQYSTKAIKRSRSIIDSFFPPEKRAFLVDSIKEFVATKPRLATFIGLNLLLTGTPLILFILFSISTLVTSILVALVVALLAAITFTMFAVGGALLVVLPIVLLTTFAACSLFLWGLTVFLIYRAVKGNAEGRLQSTESKQRQY